MRKLSVFFIVLLSILSANGQAKKPLSEQPPSALEMSVAGVRLNDEASAKAFLAEYSFRRDEANRPVYYFYNQYGTEVLALTAHSPERRFLIAAAEVFAVDLSYKKTYYVLKDKSFTSEDGIFLGERASAKSLIFGVPNRIGVKKLIAKKGVPAERKKAKKSETLIYKYAASPVGDVPAGNYRAEYVFSGGTLQRFRIETALLPKAL